MSQKEWRPRWYSRFLPSMGITWYVISVLILIAVAVVSANATQPKYGTYEVEESIFWPESNQISFRQIDDFRDLQQFRQGSSVEALQDDVYSQEDFLSFHDAERELIVWGSIIYDGGSISLYWTEFVPEPVPLWIIYSESIKPNYKDYQRIGPITDITGIDVEDGIMTIEITESYPVNFLIMFVLTAGIMLVVGWTVLLVHLDDWLKIWPDDS